MSRNNLNMSSNESRGILIILQLEEKLVVTGNNEKRTHDSEMAWLKREEWSRL